MDYLCLIKIVSGDALFRGERVKMAISLGGGRLFMARHHCIGVAAAAKVGKNKKILRGRVTPAARARVLKGKCRKKISHY